MRTLKWLAVIFAIAFAASQFIRPARTNPPSTPGRMMDAILIVPPDVRSALTRACADCHSNETAWPWYSHVAPMSWFLARHVMQGRDHINFSTWVYPGKEPKQSIVHLRMICGQVKRGTMPLKSYELIHWHSWLSAEDVKRVCDWSQAEQERLAATPDGKRDEEVQKLISTLTGQGR